MEEFRLIEGLNILVSNLGNVKYNGAKRNINQYTNGSGYNSITLNDKHYLIHRLVAETFIPNPHNKKCVDHIDNNRTNNKVENLRWATHSENAMNTKLSKRNKSGVKGISFHSRDKCWRARIQINGVEYHLGSFRTKENAIQARLNASKKYFREFANKCEKELTLNISIPSNTKVKINLNIQANDDEYKRLEQEFNDLIKKL